MCVYTHIYICRYVDIHIDIHIHIHIHIHKHAAHAPRASCRRKWSRRFWQTCPPVCMHKRLPPRQLTGLVRAQTNPRTDPRKHTRTRTRTRTCTRRLTRTHNRNRVRGTNKATNVFSGGGGDTCRPTISSTCWRAVTRVSQIHVY